MSIIRGLPGYVATLVTHHISGVLIKLIKNDKCYSPVSMDTIQSVKVTLVSKKKKIRETKTVKRLRVNKTLNLQDEELVTTSFFESI